MVATVLWYGNGNILILYQDSEIYKQNILSGIIHYFRMYQRTKVKISVLDFWVCLDSQKNI